MIWIGIACLIAAFLIRHPHWSGPLVMAGFVLIIIGVARPTHSAERNDWRYIITWRYPDRPGTVRGFSTKGTCEYTRKHDQRVPTSPCYQETR